MDDQTVAVIAIIVAAGSDVSFSISKIMVSTPEPGTFALLGMGVTALAGFFHYMKVGPNEVEDEKSREEA